MPQTPSRDSSLTFMSLPLELRHRIHSLALVSPSSITVWNGEYVYKSKPTSAWHLVIDSRAKKECLSGLAIPLLACNRLISDEAATVLYSKNTFAFLGQHNWNPIVSWLQCIGSKNRSYLTKLEFKAYQPDKAWQRLNGERIGRPGGYSKELVYARNIHLSPSVGSPKNGLVDNINPALETIFQLLGHRDSTRSVALNLMLPERNQYPGKGTIFEEGDQTPEEEWDSMDLPNLIENFRAMYTPQSEVSWLGNWKPLVWRRFRQETISRFNILEYVQNMKDHGWDAELSPMEEHDHEWKPHTEERKGVPFVLRRRPLVDPLLASSPNEHSIRYISRDIDDL